MHMERNCSKPTYPNKQKKKMKWLAFLDRISHIHSVLAEETQCLHLRNSSLF